MSITYRCKHCGQVIGKLKRGTVQYSELGLDSLSAEDKKQMIAYKNNGDMEIQIICESCEETLQEYPHYYEMDQFLQ